MAVAPHVCAASPHGTTYQPRAQPHNRIRGSGRQRAAADVHWTSMLALWRRSLAALRRAALLLVVTLATGCASGPPPPDAADFPDRFTGSTACRDCHLDVYERWSGTLMANVLLDPRERPDAILGDFDTPHPLVTFRRRTSRSPTATSGSSATSPAAATTCSCSRRNGTSRTGSGAAMEPGPAPNGGRRTTPPTRCSGRPARSATAATR